MPEDTTDPQEQHDEQPEAAEATDAQPTPEAADTPAGPDEPAPQEAAAEPAEASDEETDTVEGDGDVQDASDGEASEEEAGPDFGVQVEDVGTLKKKITVTVPEEMIEAKRKEMFGELSNTAHVPGFRVGRAPRRLIEKRFGREVSRDVRNALIGESLGKALEGSDLNVLGEPDLDLDAIELPESGDLVYDMEVEVAPEFELPELQGIPVRRVSTEATEQRIDAALDRIRLSQARYETTDEPAAEQDGVVVAAKIAGEGIDEVTTTATLRVAPGQIEGLPLVELPKALAGKKVGEAATMTVTVPAVHPNEAWRGKELTVELTLTEVRKRILPEIDDAYAQERGYDSLADYREDLAYQMEERMQMEAARAERQQVHQYLLDRTDFELPEGVANRHAARVLQRRYVDLLQAGVSEEQITEHMAQLQASVTEEAQREMKLSFILQKIADRMDIEVSEEELNARVARMAAFHDRRPERLRQELESDGSISQLHTAIIEEKAVEMLLATADISQDADDEEAEQEAAGAPAENAEAAPADEPEAAEEADKADE